MYMVSVLKKLGTLILEMIGLMLLRVVSCSVSRDEDTDAMKILML